MINSLRTQLESALIDYISDNVFGCKFYSGHGMEDKDSLPRCIVSCSQYGGLLAHAGIEEFTVDIHIITKVYSDECERLTDEIKELLQDANFSTIKSALTTSSFALNGLEYQTTAEGRDESKSLQGAALVYKAWVCFL